MPLVWKKAPVPKKDHWAEEAYTADSPRGGKWILLYRGEVARPDYPLQPYPPMALLYPPGQAVGGRRRTTTHPSIAAAKGAAEKREKSSTLNRLVDYARLPSDRRGGQNGSPRDWFLPLGKEVDAKALEMVGRKPMFLCATQKGLTLKWLIAGVVTRSKWIPNLERTGHVGHTTRSSPTVEEARVLVYRDWLLDQGLTVEVGYPVPKFPEKDGRRYIQLRIS